MAGTEIILLQIKETQLGADHPDTASSLNNLAVLYYYQHRFAEAESLLIRALAICEQTLGANHPDTVSTRESLANLRQARTAQPSSPKSMP